MYAQTKLNETKKYSLLNTITYLFLLVIKAFFIAMILLLFIILFFFTLVIGDSFFNNKQDIPLYSGYVIVSKSMIPTLKVNDAVLVKRPDNKKLYVGDIITFKSSDSLYKGITITHRIIGLQKLSNGVTVYRTKGDNNNFEDAAVVDNNSIYGKVIFKIPKIGYLKQFLANKPFFLLLAIVPLLSISILNNLSVKLEKK